jgi:hypothetical protein
MPPRKANSVATTRKPRAPKGTEALKGLVDAMLARHLQTSWPDPRQATPGWFTGKKPARYGEKIRTVAVVGAGASLPMLSVADGLAEDLEKNLETNQQEREVELDRLQRVYGLDPTHFETRLTAICRTPEAERKVKQKISQDYRRRHPSLLTYELLAHLLQHRFLDAVISFNFDELLDQSIEDELGPNEYRKIVTERDFEPGETVEQPLYIKMHGTASEPESLRFTRDRYYWTPESIVEFVEQQFDVEHLVLLNLGFSMASFDFQYLLRKPTQLEIYHVDPVSLDSEVIDEIKKQRAKERAQRTRVESSPDDDFALTDFSLPGKAKPTTEFLESAMSKIINALQTACIKPAAGPTRWRSTVRHRTVVELLKSSDTSTEARNILHLRRRAILEIAFAAAKGRGVISIASMVNERCGRYYDLYSQSAEDPDSWPKLCECGGLVESEVAPDTYEVLPDVRHEPPPVPVGPADVHRLRLAQPRKLAEHTLGHMGLPKREQDELTPLLTKTLKYLQEDTEIEIHSSDDRVCSKIFAHAVTLKTLTALQGWTRELLRTEQNFNELWVISETGEWLAQPEMRDCLTRSCEQVRLIRAFDTKLDLGGMDLDHRRLPWGRHNRHMTILCCNGEPRAAIYFARRLRASTVTPVYLYEKLDLNRMVKAFEELWELAGGYEGELSTREG